MKITLQAGVLWKRSIIKRGDRWCTFGHSGRRQVERGKLRGGGPPPHDGHLLRQLVDDLTELGDNATATLVRQAIDRFSAWKFEAGEELLARALQERRKHEQEPPGSPYFNTCVLALS
jgi:hypothetical protein